MLLNYSEDEINSILSLVNTKLGWTPDQATLERLIRTFPRIVKSIDYVAISIVSLLDNSNRNFIRKSVYNLAYAKGFTEGVTLAMLAGIPYIGNDIQLGLLAGRAAGYGYIYNRGKKQQITDSSSDVLVTKDSTTSSAVSPLPLITEESKEEVSSLPPLPPNIQHINNDNVQVIRM